MKTELSIVIVSWNTGDLLLQCLRSVISGTHEQGVEILVVDNGSSDGTPDAVQREFPSVTLTQNHANLGFAKANNIGIRKSTGRYVCLINSDVVVSEGCLDRMCAYMDQHPSVGILGPRILNCDSTVQLSCKQFPTLYNAFCRALALDAIFPNSRFLGDFLMRSWKHDTVKRVDVLSGCFWMVRRETLEDIGLLDEAFFIYGEDMDYCQRCWQKGWEIVYWPDVTAVHYGAASSSHFPVRFEVENLKGTLGYWRKHHRWPTRTLFWVMSLCLYTRRMIRGVALYIFKSTERHKLLTEIKANGACALWLLRISSSGTRWA